jgi:hypothetical protein
MRLLLLLLVCTTCKAQRLPVDKQLHIAVGAAVGTITALHSSPRKMIYNGVIAGAVAGLGKELYDSKFGGNVESLDIVATIAGAALSSVVVYKLKNILNKRHEKRNHRPIVNR